MPQGEYTRPMGSKRKLLADPSGKANEDLRRASASGKAKNWTSAKITDTQFQKEMRMRERGTGTANNEGYVGNGKIGKSKMTSSPLNTDAPERKAAQFLKHTITDN